MYLKTIQINNFRLLKEVKLSLQKDTTVIVGRNNSGKTALTEIFKRFFSGKTPPFHLEDFNLSSADKFVEAYKAKLDKKDEDVLRSLIPSIDLILSIDYGVDKSSYGQLGEFIIDLEEDLSEAVIKVSYQLKDGKIDALFEGIDDSVKGDLFEKLRERIPHLFEIVVSAIDPTDSNNISKKDLTKLTNCIGVDFINAQRGLDDATQTERDVLGKVLGSIFKNASSESAPEDMKNKTKELEKVVGELQSKIDTDFKDRLNALLPALNLFGYPGLSDPNLSTETKLDLKNILESNTIIKYQQANGISLPETYNGLGSRNLIYILFRLYDFFKKYQSNPINYHNHIIFIEEPEAHLHPQMQEVFIRKLYEIANKFSKELNEDKRWPVQFVVSTHSTHIANESSFESIRYFFMKPELKCQTFIKDLNDEFVKDERKEDREFIQKYLTLTKCDLYFADKAMLIEGPTERIIMPALIRKYDAVSNSNVLSSQYISVVEIGGAYAHHFFKFLDFLELKTLIITDLDSVDKNDSNKSCMVSKGTHTSNAGIKNWFKEKDDLIDLDTINKKNNEDKINGFRRIAYQIPEDGRKIIGRSFEDAFILANPILFDVDNADETILEATVYNKAAEYKNKKTDFAIQYAFTDAAWIIPKYIKEGLGWLSENMNEVIVKKNEIGVKENE